tara:strand:+ start:2084 stop:3292 length:1209 start_codon:yes stop_codon:yes gene_type:complete
MALKFSQKRSYYQNTKKLIDNDNWLLCVQDFFKVSQNIVTFRSNDYFQFSTTDNFLNQNKCYYRHTMLNQYNLEESKDTEQQKYQETHLYRNKKVCTIVMGNDLFSDSKQNLEERLSNSFSGECAKLLDTDLFASNIKDINNTSSVFHLKHILDYLSECDYETINVVFQMVDPNSCFKSIWWNAMHLLEHTDNNIIKSHPSYQFLNKQQIDKLLEIKGYDICKDMHFFNMEHKQNGYILLNPHEFFCLYEWSILDLLKHTLNTFTQRFKINAVAWKDFYKVCNSDNPISTIKKNYLQYTQNEQEIAYTSNYDFINSITNSKPQVILDVNDPSSTNDEKIFFDGIEPKRIFYNVIEPDDKTKILFEDGSPSKLVQPNRNLSSIDKNNQKEFAGYVLKSVGWLK